MLGRAVFISNVIPAYQGLIEKYIIKPKKPYMVTAITNYLFHIVV